MPNSRRCLLESGSKRGILLCSRQWGKSTVSAILAVHRAYTQAESLVVVASPSERQSAEWVRKAATFVRKLGIRVRGDGDNAQSIRLPNGSRIVGLPGNEATVRGFSAVNLIDEAARVKGRIVLGAKANAGGLRRGLVADEYTVWQTGFPVGGMVRRRRGVGEGGRAGD